MVGSCRVCKTNRVLSIDGYCLTCAVVFTGNWYALMPARRPTKDVADYRKARGVLHIEGQDAVEEIRKLRGG